MKSIMSIWAGIAFSLSGCGGNDSAQSELPIVTPQTMPFCNGEVFASGTVTREFTDFTYNEPFIPNDDAHVRLRLSTAFIDGPSTILVEHDEPFIGIPFGFRICGNAESIAMQREGMLFISVAVFNHSGSDGRVGDLISEYLNEIPGPVNDLEIVVSGLEHCDSESAGGFCTTNE